MKITKKRLLLSISIVATALVTGGVVYAFSSSSFLTQAQKYVSSQCNSALISSKNTVANNQKATVCYNYYKNIEQDASISGLDSKSTSLSKSVPILLDANGNSLGMALSSDTFYDATINRFISLKYGSGSQPESINIQYATTDCSGIPYSTSLIDINSLYQSNLGQSNAYKYFIVDYANKMQSNINLLSYWLNGSCVAWNWNNVNNPGPNIQSAYQVTQITPDISFPIAIPTTIK